MIALRQDLALRKIDDERGEEALHLRLLRSEDGTPEYTMSLASGVAPSQSEGETSYANVPPDQQLVWAQENWNGGCGALKTKRDYNRHRGYVESSGVDARTEGELSLSIKSQTAAGWEGEDDFLIRNPGAEPAGTIVPWVAGTGVTVTSTADARRSGQYGFRIVTDGARPANSVLMSQSLANPAAWGAMVLDVYFAVWLRRVVGTQSGIYFKVVGLPPETPSATVTSSTFTAVNVNPTISVPPAQVTLQLLTSALETTPHTYDADDFLVHMNFSAGVPNAGITTFQEFGGNLFMGMGNGVFMYNSTDSVWVLVDLASGEVTDLKAFGTTVARLYAARGSISPYRYSPTPQTPGTWTDATGTPVAEFFARTRNALGDYALMRAILPNQVSLTTDPTNSVNWGTPTTVGDRDRDITALHEAWDTVAVGREDGLWEYDRSQSLIGANQYRDRFPLNLSPSVDNFRRGLFFINQLYLSVQEQGVYAYDGNAFQDLAQQVEIPGLAAHSGRIKAYAEDGKNLWMVEEAPALGDDLTKEFHLLALRIQQTGGVTERVVHELRHFVMSRVSAATKWVDMGVEPNQPYLVLGGNKHTGIDFGVVPLERVAVRRFFLPKQHQTPRFDVEPKVDTGGWMILSSTDFGYPDIEKGFRTITLETEGLDEEDHFARLSFRLDNDTAWTVLETDDITGNNYLTVSPTMTVPLPPGTVGRKVQFYLELFTADTVTPVIKAIILRAVWNPVQLRTWEVTCEVESSMAGRRGPVIGEIETVLRGRLETLRKEAAIVLTDIDGEDVEVKLRSYQWRPLKNEHPPGVTASRRRAWLVSLALVETP